MRSIEELHRLNKELTSRPSSKTLERIALAEKRRTNNLDPGEYKVTFETLEQTDIVKRLMTWNPTMESGIVLQGPCGTGKSTLAKCIMNRFASSDYQCMYITSGAYMKLLKECFDTDDPEVSELPDKLLNSHLTVLDDLGSEKSSEWSIEQIFEFIDHRMRKRRHTIVTTNLSPQQILKRYGERIHDRLIESCTFVNVEGQSYRKKRYKAEF